MLALSFYIWKQYPFFTAEPQKSGVSESPVSGANRGPRVFVPAEFS